MTRWSVLTPSRLAKRVKATLASANVRAELTQFESESEIRSLVARESERGGKHFIAVGNDGIAGEVLNALMHLIPDHKPVLGILPGDDGNEFARTFGLPQTMEEAVTHIGGDDTYACDIGRIEGAWGWRYFLNSATAGRVVSPTSAPRMGFELITEKRTYQGKATGVLIANGQFVEGGRRAAPRATVTDAALDVQMWDIRRREQREFLRLVASAGHLKDRRVRRASVGYFELNTEKPWPVLADGISIGESPFRGRSVPAAVSLKI